MSYPPIEDYALLSDCHSAALVSKDGSIDWCCFDRFDARPVFGRILDWERGGYFRIAPRAEHRTTRRYLPDTNVLETTFDTHEGRLVVTDCLVVDERSYREGVPRPHRQLVRRVMCTQGTVDAGIEFAPRFDYGTTVPRLELAEDGLGVVFGGADGLCVQSDIAIERIDLCACSGTASLRAGESCVVAVQYSEPHLLDAKRLDPGELTRRVDETCSFWRKWISRSTYDGPYREAVMRSALVLKGLTNAPTGAIAAAATTSLPEEIKGKRNWDYRHSWLRDAALNLYSLFQLGYSEEATDFMAWIRRTTAGHADELQPVYGIGGEHMLHEIELAGPDGYAGSRPVRIGNAAAQQFQLDIYGALLDTAWLYHRNGGRIDPVFWELLCGVVDVVERYWEEPDHGLWEVRSRPEHFVSSKVMAWVAVDRALRLSDRLDLKADRGRWSGLRERIHGRVLSDGVDAETGAFVRSFGSKFMDASALLVPLVRFLPPEDPRVRATVERVERELCEDGYVKRYIGDDGLPGEEGAFVMCSFWLVDNLALIGERERAVELFERLLENANDVGLFAEQIDPGSGHHLGNFPQAFSHTALIGATRNLQRTARR